MSQTLLNNTSLYPTITVEVEFDTDPTSAPVTWTDITAYVRTIQTRRGRQHDLARIEAGTCTLTLSNSDRRFDPTYTAGPYYPNVKPMRRIRILAAWSSVTYPVWAGYVEAWTPSWPADGHDDIVTVQAVDAFKVLNLASLQGNSYPGQRTAERLWNILTDSDIPTSDWSLEIGGRYLAVTANMSSVANAFVYDDMINLSDYTIQSGDVLKYDVYWSGTALIGFDYTTNGGSTLRDSGATDQASLSAHPITDISGSADGQWYARTISLPVGHVGQTITKYDIACEKDATGAFSGRLRNMRIEDGSNNRRKKIWDDVDPLPSFTNDIRADTDQSLAVSIDYQDTDIPGAVTVTASGTISGEAALAHTLDVIDTEQGLFYASRGGTLIFEPQGHRLANEATSGGTFTDHSGSSGLEYLDLVASFDDADIWTQVIVTPSGGTAEILTDAAQGSVFFQRTLPVGSLHARQGEAAGTGSIVLYRQKDARYRLPSMTMAGARNPGTMWPKVLGAEISDRFTVERVPPGGGTISQDVHVEQVEHSIGPDSWLTVWQLSKADEAQSFWQLGTAANDTLGTATTVGY